MTLSLNKEAAKIAKKIFNNPEKYNVAVERRPSGAYIIDAGVNAKGGFLVGKLIVEICLGGLGKANITTMRLNSLELPSITVYTDHPAISTLGSQMAGWRIKVGEYTALGSGPARALAWKPKSIYEKIGYKDESNEAVIVLETLEKPPEEVIKVISDSCHVSPEKLFIIVVSTSSIAGLTQVAGRVVEVGLYRLVELGFDPKSVVHAFGEAPIPPIHPDNIESMGRSNDAILYGGSVHIVIDHPDDEYLKRIASESISSASRDYGRPFAEIFRSVGQDFYKIDPKVFAPAKMTIVNRRTGKVFAAGRINAEILSKSIGLYEI